VRTSIALCTYNGQAHLREQLASLAAQTAPPHEVVVGDDGSTDDTVAIIEDWLREAPFPVRLTTNEQRLGVTANFAATMARCEGEIICPCDQDDIWRPDKLAVIREAFAKAEELGLVFSDLRLVSENGKPAGGTQWQRLGFDERGQQLFAAGRGLEILFRYNVINGAALAFRSRFREHVLPIPSCWLHDEWIGLIVTALGGAAAIREPLVDYRLHGDQATGRAKSGLGEQFRHARQHMGRDYFERMVERGEALLERLRELRPMLPDEKAIAMAEEKCEHARARLALRDRRFGPRLRAVCGEWRAGRYRRFGYGWKSAAQDVFLS